MKRSHAPGSRLVNSGCESSSGFSSDLKCRVGSSFKYESSLVTLNDASLSGQPLAQAPVFHDGIPRGRGHQLCLTVSAHTEMVVSSFSCPIRDRPEPLPDGPGHPATVHMRRSDRSETVQTCFALHATQYEGVSISFPARGPTHASNSRKAQ